MPEILDKTDLRLLDEMQRDCARTAEVLAEAVGISRSAVQRRLKRLRARKIIEAECAQISPKAVGRPMTFIVAVSLERETSEITRGFVARIQEIEAVQQCYYVTGEADFIIILTAADMQEYDSIVQELFVDNPTIRGFHTNVVINRTKVGLRLPVS